MTWFLKARLKPAALVMLVVATLTSLLAQGALLPVPNLGQGQLLPITVGMFAPSLIACAILAILNVGTTTEARTTRPISLIDAGLATALTTTPALVLAAAPLLTSTATWVGVRNTLGFVGVGLIARRLIPGPANYAAPASYAMITAVISSTTTNPLLGWPYQPIDTPTTTIALTLLAVGIAVGTGRAPITHNANQQNEDPVATA